MSKLDNKTINMLNEHYNSLDEIRVYAIEETEDVHEISNDDFMNQAEDLGYVWSLLGFQNELNCEGDPTLDINCFEKLHFRFINIGNNNNE